MFLGVCFDTTIRVITLIPRRKVLFPRAGLVIRAASSALIRENRAQVDALNIDYYGGMLDWFRSFFFHFS